VLHGLRQRPGAGADVTDHLHAYLAAAFAALALVLMVLGQPAPIEQDVHAGSTSQPVIYVGPH
jgi:hypothetical protein